MLLYLLTLLSAPDTCEFANFRVNSDSVDDYHNEEQIIVNPTDSLNLVACWRDFRLGYRQIGIGYSFDGGLTWEDYLIPSDHTPFWQDSDPGLTTDAEGNIYLVILSLISTSDSNALVVLKSDNGGQSFNPSVNAVISAGNPFEDKELIACDRTNSEHRGNLYIAWARFSTSVNVYSVASYDGNESWETPVRVSDQSNVQWPVPCVGKDGTYYIAWTRLSNPYAIMLDKSSDGGLTWGEDITVAPTIFRSPDAIDGYYTTFAFPAIDADITDGPYSGNVYIAYMDQGANGTDIFFTKSEDQGETWSAPMRISGEDQPGNDQFHQWLCVDNTGIIHVIFYDQRNGIADNLLDIYYVYSDDGGDTWSEPIRVSDVSSKYKLGPVFFPEPTPSPMPAGPIGEYIGLAAWNGTPFPVWTDFREDGMQRIYFGWKVRDTIPEAVCEPPVVTSPVLKAAFDGNLLSIHLRGLEHFEREFSLYNSAGLTLATISSSSTDFTWDPGHLPHGVYFLHARGKGLDESVKVFKLR